MDKQAVIEYFDEHAAAWDADLIRRDEIIARILDNGGIRAGVSVLDVACGTGVLFPDYLARGVASVTAVDISPRMAELAAAKYPGSCIEVLCGDIETLALPRQFDRCMVYNAFPHFPDPAALLDALAARLLPGGRLSIAHGMSRERIDGHHKGSASPISRGLMSAEALAALMRRRFDVDVVVSDNEMYQVSGVKTA